MLHLLHQLLISPRGSECLQEDLLLLVQTYVLDPARAQRANASDKASLFGYARSISWFYQSSGVAVWRVLTEPSNGCPPSRIVGRPM